MRVEPHTGTVIIDVAGEAVPLRFTWAALSRLHGEFGKGWEQTVERAVSENDLAGLAFILEAASGMPAKWWGEQSPPLVPTVNAVRTALSIAYFGAEVPPDVDPPKAASPMMTRFAALIGRGRKWVATLWRSGV